MPMFYLWPSVPRSIFTGHYVYQQNRPHSLGKFQPIG